MITPPKTDLGIGLIGSLFCVWGNINYLSWGTFVKEKV